jgi:CheY-like chemotaxis protein
MSSKEETDGLHGLTPSQEGTDKIKILVVEDVQVTRLLYEKGLFSVIFDKKMVVSGREAILVYQEWHPDIIVLDIFLPEMTGYQVLKEIRTTLADNKTTIVMATGLSGREDILSCVKLGIEGYIVKPFQWREIGAKILDYYAKKEPERATKAGELCREIAKQAHVQGLLNKETSETRESTRDVSGSAPGTETGEAGGEKEAGGTPAEKKEN